jgi:hypothetical protein
MVPFPKGCGDYTVRWHTLGANPGPGSSINTILSWSWPPCPAVILSGPFLPHAKVGCPAPCMHHSSTFLELSFFLDLLTSYDLSQIPFPLCMSKLYTPSRLNLPIISSQGFPSPSRRSHFFSFLCSHNPWFTPLRAHSLHSSLDSQDLVSSLLPPPDRVLVKIRARPSLHFYAQNTQERTLYMANPCITFIECRIHMPLSSRTLLVVYNYKQHR